MKLTLVLGLWNQVLTSLYRQILLKVLFKFDEKWRDNILGGADGVGKDNTKEGLGHVLSFIRNNNHTNIIVVYVPHRHDHELFMC